MLASAARNDKIQLWDLVSGQQRQASSDPGPKVSFPTLAFARNGELLVARAPPGLQLWDLRSGQQMTVESGPQTAIETYTQERFDRDLWKERDAEQQRAITRMLGASTAVSPDGSTIAFGMQKGRIGLWDTLAARQTRTLDPNSNESHRSKPASADWSRTRELALP
jgi:WD40 repeat protein